MTELPFLKLYNIQFESSPKTFSCDKSSPIFWEKKNLTLLYLPDKFVMSIPRSCKKMPNAQNIFENSNNTLYQAMNALCYTLSSEAPTHSIYLHEEIRKFIPDLSLNTP